MTANLIGKALGVNSSLHSLDLGGNPLYLGRDGVFVSALQKNTALRTLKMSDCLIGSHGANALARALKRNSSMLSLDLSCNYIGNHGAQSMCLMLEGNTVLTSLSLRSNNISLRTSHRRLLAMSRFKAWTWWATTLVQMQIWMHFDEVWR
jgi:Ran GTPase-activating protein (RanGAP) involved in mRNA processing and transport